MGILDDFDGWEDIYSQPDWDTDDWVRNGIFPQSTLPKGKPQTEWRDVKGNLISLKHMKLGHLKNTKKFIEDRDSDCDFSVAYRSICMEICRRERDLNLRPPNM